MQSLTRVSAILRKADRKTVVRQGQIGARWMSSKEQNENEDEDDLEDRISLAGTKTYDNLRDAFAKKAMATARYEYYAQKADVEGLTEAAQALRGLANSAREQAFGHMEFLDEGEDIDSESSSTEMNINTCLAHERKEFEDHYPKWAETAYNENISDVGTWMESLRDTSYRNMCRLIRLQEAVEDIYKGEQDEVDADNNGPNGVPYEQNSSKR
eukprot:Plantae.Rhodophyta-Purpureofilum_apyrenoidigerum.ctg18512.p2 GENE.Plantae.Rhodophyta-Purpureofilum_apyrenoidigerum.ctg18512~~Plantae.Rhodophyta-Purpureofilum_apyrenoidigerum.ctg18512.p2  ORF type:complete len:213 (-),score=40.54 Plantae.Rhodophyta-Purpureofilum_apyrenoidigerum.ctg18512:526-1164(-)